MIEHLVQKLANTSKDNKRAIELLQGLSVFCTYQGVPIKKNQSKSNSISYLVNHSGINLVYHKIAQVA